VDFWWVMERSSLRRLGWTRTFTQSWKRVEGAAGEWSLVVEPRYHVDKETHEAGPVGGLVVSSPGGPWVEEQGGQSVEELAD